MTKIGRYVLILILTICAGFPVYWMAATALATNEELYNTGQSFGLNLSRLPGLVSELAPVPLLRWLLNTGFIALGTTVVSLLLGACAGYALSRFKFHGKGAINFFLFMTQVVPEALILVPLYAMFIVLGLLNSQFGLILANAAFSLPVATFILKGAIDQIPHEIEESAKIDNCPRVSALTMIILPLIAPSLAAASVIAFFAGWNEFLFASVFLMDQSLWPASVGLASFIGQYETPLPAVMAAALIFSAPAIVFFLLVQRRIVSGLTSGAVKG